MEFDSGEVLQTVLQVCIRGAKEFVGRVRMTQPMQVFLLIAVTLWLVKDPRPLSLIIGKDLLIVTAESCLDFAVKRDLYLAAELMVNLTQSDHVARASRNG